LLKRNAFVLVALLPLSVGFICSLRFDNAE